MNVSILCIYGSGFFSLCHLLALIDFDPTPCKFPTQDFVTRLKEKAGA